MEENEELYKDALEALELEKTLQNWSRSLDLVCHCSPISQKEVFEYVLLSKNKGLETREILNALRIAQGCQTCFDSAFSLVEEIKKSIR